MTRKIRIWAYTSPVDMRKGFDGLSGLVYTQLKRNPLEGDAFLFVSRNRKRAKVLLWDGTGLCIWSKKMEQGRFAKLWGMSQEEEIELTQAELAVFLDGWEKVGKVRLSGAEFCLPSLIKHEITASISAC